MKVVCVYYLGRHISGPDLGNHPIFVGEIYTVVYEYEGHSFVLAERPDNQSYRKRCFRPLKEVLADINIEELTGEVEAA